MLSLIQIPEHCDTILAARSTKSSVGRHCDGVDVSSVPNQVGDQFTVLEVPDLDQFIPTSRDNQRLGREALNRVGDVGSKADAADPLRVTVLLDGVLALSQSIPQLDGFVTRARDNLTVVGGESNAEDIFLVTNKLAMANACIDIPKAKSTIP